MKNINLFTYLWRFLKNKKLVLCGWLVLETLRCFFEVFVAQYFNKKAINYFQVESPVFKTGLLLVILYAISNNGKSFFDIIKPKFKMYLVSVIEKNIREDAFNYTLQHSTNYFNNSFSGDISSKILSIATNYSKMIVILVSFFSNFSVFVFVFIFYAKINIILSILFVVFGIAYCFIYGKYSKEYSTKTKEKAGTINSYFGFIVDVFSNIQNVKIFSRDRFEKINSGKNALNIMRSEKEVAKAQIKLHFVNFFAVFLLVFPIICTSSILMVKNAINFGDFVAVIIVLSIANFFLTNIIKNLNTFYSLKGNIQNSIEKIYQPIEINSGNKKLNISNGKIIFKNVDFKYE